MSKYKKDIVDYKTALKLYRFGFKLGSLSYYHKYTNAFVYDGDENHPESHKKGEIRMYDLYHVNDKNDKNSYEAPTFYELQNYFFDKHNIVFTVSHSYNRDGELEFTYHMSNSKTKKTIVSKSNQNTYYDSFCEGIYNLIELLHKKEL